MVNKQNKKEKRTVSTEGGPATIETIDPFFVHNRLPRSVGRTFKVKKNKTILIYYIVTKCLVVKKKKKNLIGTF